MEARQYNRQEHGQELWTWWVQRDPLDFDCLDLLPMVDHSDPECHLGHGVVVFNDAGHMILAGFAMMIVGVGICFLERAVSRPQTPVRTTRAAGAMAVEWLELYAKALDYNLFITHCRHEGMARAMEKMGFARSGGTMIELAKFKD